MHVDAENHKLVALSSFTSNADPRCLAFLFPVFGGVCCTCLVALRQWRARPDVQRRASTLAGLAPRAVRVVAGNTHLQRGEHDSVPSGILVDDQRFTRSFMRATCMQNKEQDLWSFGSQDR